MIDEITKIKNYYQLLLARNQELSAKNKILQEKIH
jgi:hypothetical protein